MNSTETGLVLKYVAANWPSAPITEDTIDVYRLEMAQLGFDETVTCLREDFAQADFAPTPMKLRAAVLERRSPALTYEQAMSELLDRIATVGYSSPEPVWSSPIVGEIVRLRGGWTEVCQATPARAALDPHGMSTFNTWHAQFRDEFRQVAAREHRDAVHAVLSAGEQVERVIAAAPPGSAVDGDVAAPPRPAGEPVDNPVDNE